MIPCHSAARRRRYPLASPRIASSLREIERQPPPGGGCLSSLSSLHRKEERLTMAAYGGPARSEGLFLGQIAEVRESDCGLLRPTEDHLYSNCPRLTLPL